MHNIQAVVFDVFGTLVDWRTSIAREAQAHLSPLGIQIDWIRFADAWRDQYQPAMQEVWTGRIPFSRLDRLHRRNLEAVVYLSAAEAFDLAPEETMMVAAHSSDLAAAATAGLRTAFVARPDEYGPNRGETAALVPVDLSVVSLLELARALDT